MDTTKLVNGYHYGFLEPIRKQQQAYTNKQYDVWLYSINNESKERFWIGEITNVIVLDNDEANEAYEIYKKKGWIKEMENQIKSTNADSRGFSNWKGVNLFNIKYKPKDLHINEQYYLLPKNHIAYSQSRYAFVHYLEEYGIKPILNPGFNFTGNGNANYKAPPKKFITRKPQEVELLFLHNQISSALSKYLSEKFEANNISREHSTGYGNNKIDIVQKVKQGYIFYEIKTFNSLTTCVRQALGQLLEYCYFPNCINAKELIIVSQHQINKEMQLYFKHLRKSLNLPIFYQSFDLEKNTLSDKD